MKLTNNSLLSKKFYDGKQFSHFNTSVAPNAIELRPLSALPLVRATGFQVTGNGC